MTDSVFKAVQVSKRVYWVGAIDWSLREFHGYTTERGTTYNAYLVLGDKPVLIDTVKRPFLDEMLSRIQSVVDPCQISTIVSHHAEMDHTGCLPEMAKMLPRSRVITSASGVNALGAHFELPVPVEGVKDGAEVQFDGVRMTMHETKMLHWPESMMSVLPDDRVMFSQDGFGMHLASHERFTDQLPKDVVHWECAKYFANILMPYSSQLLKQAPKLAALASGADMVATDHGPIWRTGIQDILQWYAGWAERRMKPKAVVVFDTMWGSTAQLARAIGEGATEGGIECKLLHVGPTNRSDVVTELLDSAALVVGTPALNGLMLPPLADVLCYVKGLRPRNLIGAVFGSYGWSPSAGRQVFDELKSMNVELIADPLLVKFVPKADDLQAAKALGRELAIRVKAHVGVSGSAPSAG